MDDGENSGNRVERFLKEFDPEAMTVDELWQVHERIEQTLRSKIQSEQEKLDAQLSLLTAATERSPSPVHPKAASAKGSAASKPAKRHYPEVKPKYRSLKDPSQTWAGRGKQPLWLLAEMKGGKTLDDFLIAGKQGGRKRAR